MQKINKLINLVLVKFAYNNTLFLFIYFIPLYVNYNYYLFINNFLKKIYKTKHFINKLYFY